MKLIFPSFYILQSPAYHCFICLYLLIAFLHLFFLFLLPIFIFPPFNYLQCIWFVFLFSSSLFILPHYPFPLILYLSLSFLFLTIYNLSVFNFPQLCLSTLIILPSGFPFTPDLPTQHLPCSIVFVSLRTFHRLSFSSILSNDFPLNLTSFL